MKQVRMAIIGVGGMGEHHCRSLSEVEGVELVAVCDIDRERLKFVCEKHGVPGYTDYRAILEGDVCDAVLIATPHYAHPPITIEAFHHGKHVLCEKPLGVYTEQAEEAIDEHSKHPELVFGIMFQMRTAGIYRKLKDLIDSGEIGTLTRMIWIDTAWFRSQAYYDSGGWRATWSGEGGGVLLNQCPHTLDLLQWLMGMPMRLCAFCSLGKNHDIEVEDEVTAYMEWENGATGTFVTTTSEAPGTSRQEITGTRGKIVVENGEIRFYRNRIPSDEFIETSKDLFGTPEAWKIAVPPAQGEGSHIELIQNFVNAVLKGEQLVSPGEEGIHSLSLANAMLMSGLQDAWVEFPLDGSAYKKLLNKLCKNSRYKKKVRKLKDADMEASFHK